MPELPEVNTVAVLLNRTISEDEITNVQVYCHKLRYPLPTPEKFAAIVNKKITAVTRMGKLIMFNFGSEKYLQVHLGMTGAFVLHTNKEDSQASNKHLHVKMALRSGRYLSFVDPRKFGYLAIVTKPELVVPEPLKEQLSNEYLSKLCRNTARPIKLLILDQKAIVGLGNIYANEALLEAGIHPCRPAQDLNKKEIFRLRQAILKTIRIAIKNGLNSIKQRPLIDTETIHFPVNPVVYGKNGQPCSKCKAIIEKIVLSGRGTYFCPNCQQV